MADFLRCKDCKHDMGKCLGVSRRGSHKNCFEPKVMTNADRIRSMSDEELAKIIRCPYEIDEEPCVNPGSCLDCCLDWLQQPEEEVTP